jgi:hypothetical protein
MIAINEISTNFLVEPNPEIICILSTDTLKVSASFSISSLLILPLSGLDFIDGYLAFLNEEFAR